MDRNGDYFNSDFGDGGEGTYYFDAGDVGAEFSFDLFIRDIPPILSWGGLFFTPDSAKVADESFDYATPDGWIDQPFGISPPPLPYELPDAPAGRRYYLMSTDFTFSDPIESPAQLGTFTFRCAGEGLVRVVFDLTYGGYWTSDWSSGVFDDGYPCGPLIDTTATHQESWGAVKKLFR